MIEWLRIGELLEGVRGIANCPRSKSLGWVPGTGCTVHLLAATADSCHNIQVLQRHVLLRYCCLGGDEKTGHVL